MKTWFITGAASGLGRGMTEALLARGDRVVAPVHRIVEPGPTETGFRGAVDHAEAMASYAGTPVGTMRRAIGDGGFVLKGDAGRTVAAMIAAADASGPTHRPR